MKYVAAQAADEDVVLRRNVNPMARAFHCAEDFAGLDVDPHDTAGESVVGDVLDIVAMGHDPHLIFGRDEDVLRCPQVGPHSKELAVGIKELDAVVLAVTGVDRTFRINRNRVDDVKLTRTRAMLAPKR